MSGTIVGPVDPTVRLHLISVPHTNTTEDHAYCAFTTDVRDFASMMTLRGHEVYLYAGPHNEAIVTEHVPLVDDAWQATWFGGYAAGQLFPENLFANDTPWWQQWNLRAVAAIEERIQPGDYVLPILGHSFKQIIDRFQDDYITAEWMCGYPSNNRYTKNVNYVSYAWRNHCEGRAGMCHANWQDSVISNPFAMQNQIDRDDKGYLLFIGRKNESKGLHIANDIALRSGRRLVACGQGPTDLAPDAEHHGVVTGYLKQRLIECAHAVLVPSIYVEPFGKIVVEANLRGVPAITSDFGAFSETVTNGRNGQRCRTMKEFVAAVDRPYAPPEVIQREAEKRFAFNPTNGRGRMGDEMESWLERLRARTAEDWYADAPEPKEH